MRAPHVSRDVSSWQKADETDHPPERRLEPRMREKTGGELGRPAKADMGRPLTNRKRVVFEV